MYLSGAFGFERKRAENYCFGELERSLHNLKISAKSGKNFRKAFLRWLRNLRESTDVLLHAVDFVKDERGRKYFEDEILGIRNSISDEIPPEFPLQHIVEFARRKTRSVLSILRELEVRCGAEINVSVVGWGEISVVFAFERKNPFFVERFVFKKLPYFTRLEDVKRYLDAFSKYTEILGKIGINLPNQKVFVSRENGFCVWVLQEKIPLELFGHKLVHTISKSRFLEFFELVLERIRAWWNFVKESEDVKVGLDAQISNWAWVRGVPVYVDTTTPLVRVKGKELLPTDAFLKTVPTVFEIIIKLFLLDSVLSRYYNMRDVVLDLVANFIKEGKADIIPDLLEVANRFVCEEFEPITLREVERYYSFDEKIWRFFQFARRVERFFVQKILRRKYKVPLPGKIKRR